MVVKVDINGFNRIGRLAFRRIQDVEGTEVACINDLTDPTTLTYLLKYGTAQGRFDGDVVVKDGGFGVNGQFVKISAERDPEQTDWTNDGVEVVLKATGFFATKATAEKHLHEDGAKKAVITAPGGSDVKTIVLSTNHEILDGTETAISADSCTTSCLASMANALNKSFGLKVGTITAIHGYTGDQMTLDVPYCKSDFRHTHAAAEDIVPNSTGAAKVIGLVIPELSGKPQGHAQHVLVPVGSLAGLVSALGKKVTAEEVNAATQVAATGSFGYSTDPVVSRDTVGTSFGSLFGAVQIEVTETADGTQLVKTVSWYDNEMSYTSQPVRTLGYFTEITR